MINLSTEALARGASRRPWITIAVWALALVPALVLTSTLLIDSLSTDFSPTNDPESERANNLLEQRLGESEDFITEMVIVRSNTLTVDDPAYQTFVMELFDSLIGLGDDLVMGGMHYYIPGGDTLVSENRRTTLIPMMMPKDAAGDVKQVHEIVDAANEQENFEVLVTGEATMISDFIEVMEETMSTGEGIGLGVALVVLLLVFGAVVAAALPIGLAIVAVIVALGIITIAAQFFNIPLDAMSMTIMMGLAVGIDYSLFIVSRYREERDSGMEKAEAISAAGATANRTVLFSGMTVVLALLGLTAVPNTVFIGLGICAVLVVGIAVLAALTLLPAMLCLLGDKINVLGLPLIGRRKGTGVSDEGGGFWYWVARAVMGRPVISLVVAAGLLIAVAIPYFDINLGSAGVSTLPEGRKAKEGFLVLQREFGFGQGGPALVVVDGQPDSEAVVSAIERLEASIEADSSFVPVSLDRYPNADLSVVSVRLSGDPWGKEAMDAIDRLRNDYIPEAFAGVPAEALVTGETAEMVDMSQTTEAHTPIVFAFVLGLSFLVLTLAFRSIVVPLKSIVMNLLSVGAAYGLLVLVFQRGIGADLLGFQQVDAIEVWIPLFLFCVLFGLSMDYHVFLLSRVRERFVQTGDNSESVAFGLRSTGRLITGAALIMVAVFGGFALGDTVMLQQMGFGLATAVIIDATIVRSVLVPATMRLLGNWNWYLPGWLSWMPDVGVGEARRAARRSEAGGPASPSSSSGSAGPCPTPDR